ncbi:MAG TPA: acyltransferase [Chthoniobacteraceae bacterium]|jgi:acetyltransferase-like isoleucine patch superfamily enzyme
MDLVSGVLQPLASRARIVLYRLAGMRIRGPVTLRAIEFPRRPRGITLEAGASLDRGVTLLTTNDAARIVIGRSCYLNRHTMIDAEVAVELGEHVMVGPFCYLTDHDHTFAAGARPAEGPLIAAPTRIGARCWIGAHVSILKGVTIGEGTVIGAGSIVTKSLPAQVVAVGNPARVIRKLAAE